LGENSWVSYIMSTKGTTEIVLKAVGHKHVVRGYSMVSVGGFIPGLTCNCRISRDGKVLERVALLCEVGCGRVENPPPNPTMLGSLERRVALS